MESEWTSVFEEPRTIKDHINRHLAQKKIDLRRNKVEKMHMYIEDVHNVTTGTDLTDDNFTSISQRPSNSVDSDLHVNLSVPYADMVTHKSFWQAQPVINIKELTETSVQNYKDLLNNQNNSRMQNSSILSINIQSKYFENPIIIKKWYPCLSKSGKLSFQGLKSEKSICTDYLVYRYSTKRFADAQGVVYLLSGQLKYSSNIPKYIYENFCGGIPYSWKEINLEWVEFIKSGSSPKFQWGKYLEKNKNFNMTKLNGKIPQKNDESISNLTFTKKSSSPMKKNSSLRDINSPENYTYDFNRPSIIDGNVNSTPLHIKENFELNKTPVLSATSIAMSRSNRSVSSVQMLQRKIAKLQAMLEVAKQRESLCDESIVSEMESIEIQKSKLSRMEKLMSDKRPFAHLNFERDKDDDDKSLKSKIETFPDEATRNSKDSSIFKVPSSVPLSMTLLRRRNKDLKRDSLNDDEIKTQNSYYNNINRSNNLKNNSIILKKNSSNSTRSGAKYSQNEESSHNKYENHSNKHEIRYVNVEVHKELYDTGYYKEKQKFQSEKQSDHFDSIKNKTLKILSSSDSDDDVYDCKTNSKCSSKNDPIDLKRKYNPTDTPPPPNKRQQIEIVEARIGVTDTEACSFIDTDEQMSDTCDTFKTAKNSVSQINIISKEKLSKAESINKSAFNNKKNNMKLSQDSSEEERELINTTKKSKNSSVNSSKKNPYNLQKSIDYNSFNNDCFSEDIVKKSKHTNNIKVSHHESESELSDEKEDINRLKNLSISCNSKLKDLDNTKFSSVNINTDLYDEKIKIKTMNNSKSFNSNNISCEIQSKQKCSPNNYSQNMLVNSKSKNIDSSESEQDSFKSDEESASIKIANGTSSSKKFKENISVTNSDKKKQNSYDLRRSSLKNLMTPHTEFKESLKNSGNSQFTDATPSNLESDTSLKEKLEHIISLISTKSNSSISNDNSCNSKILNNDDSKCISPENEFKPAQPDKKQTKNNSTNKKSTKRNAKQLTFSGDELIENESLKNTRMNDQEEENIKILIDDLIIEKKKKIFKKSMKSPKKEIDNENNKRRKSLYKRPIDNNIKLLDISDLNQSIKTTLKNNLKQTRRTEINNKEKISKSNKKNLNKSEDNRNKNKKTKNENFKSRRELLIDLKNKLKNTKTTKQKNVSFDDKIINLKSNKNNTRNNSQSNSSGKNQSRRKSIRLVNYSLNTSSDMCTDSDERDRDDHDSSDTDNDSTETILLKNWRPEVETMYCSNCFVYIIGDKISVTGKVLKKNFKSAEITERIANYKVQDVKKTTYILHGKLYDPKNVVPDKLKNILRNGFPTNAFEMMDKWYKSTREIYDNIQNKLNVSEKDFNEFEEKLYASGISLVESEESDHDSRISVGNQKNKTLSKNENGKRKKNKIDEYNFTVVNNETFHISGCDEQQNLLNITTMNNVNASRYGRIRKAPVKYWEGERFLCLKDQTYYKPPNELPTIHKNKLKLLPKSEKEENQTFLKLKKPSIQRESLYSSINSIESIHKSTKKVNSNAIRKVKSESRKESNVKQLKKKSVKNFIEKVPKDIKSPVNTQEKPVINSRKITSNVDGKENIQKKLRDRKQFKSKISEKVISSKIIKKKDRQNNLKNIKSKINFNKKNMLEKKEKISKETSSDYTDSGIVHSPNSIVYNDCYVILEKIDLKSKLNIEKKNDAKSKTLNKTFTKPKKFKKRPALSIYDISKHKCKRTSAKKYFDIGSDYTNSVTSDSDLNLILDTSMKQIKKSVKKKRRLYNEQEWLFELSKKNQEYLINSQTISELSKEAKLF